MRVVIKQRYLLNSFAESCFAALAYGIPSATAG